MLQRKRVLKKEQSKEKLKLIIILSFIFVVVIFLGEIIYFNFSFGRTFYLNPIAKNAVSNTAILEEKLRKANVNFITVSASSDSSLVVSLSGSGEVIFSSKKDIGSQISSLQLILTRLTIEGKSLKILDFRFDNPVISF